MKKTKNIILIVWWFVGLLFLYINITEAPYIITYWWITLLVFGGLINYAKEN